MGVRVKYEILAIEAFSYLLLSGWLKEGYKICGGLTCMIHMMEFLDW